MSQVFLASAALIAGLLLGVWLASLKLRDVSIIDMFWGTGFVLVAWLTWLLTAPPAGALSGDAPSRWLLPLLTTVWGLRLSGYLAWRMRGEPEDKRYAAMREKRGTAFRWQSLYLVFGLQGVVLWIVSLPLQAGIARAQPGWHWLHIAGALLWTVGFIFEAGGDWQLARFRARGPAAGKVLDRGLWRYTRHPNYFGDCCVWWGLTLVALAGQPPSFWLLLASPLLMTVLLLWFSGVTLLEKSLQETRPGYAAYTRRTSAFFPWPPREEG